jgi:hypothetical protein
MLVLLMIPAALASAMAFQATSSQSPSQKDPTKLPARDAHQDLLVAADPWVTAEEYKARFPKENPFDYGIMAIDVYFKNDGAMPVRINLATIALTITHTQSANDNLPSLSAEDVANYMTGGKKTWKQPPNSAKSPIPIPIEPKTNKKDRTRDSTLPPPNPEAENDKRVQVLGYILQAAQIHTDLVPPHSTVRGLVYFDVDGHFDWTTTARLFVPDLKTMGTEKALFFFDVDLAEAVEQKLSSLPLLD